MVDVQVLNNHMLRMFMSFPVIGPSRVFCYIMLSIQTTRLPPQPWRGTGWIHWDPCSLIHSIYIITNFCLQVVLESGDSRLFVGSSMILIDVKDLPELSLEQVSGRATGPISPLSSLGGRQCGLNAWDRLNRKLPEEGQQLEDIGRRFSSTSIIYECLTWKFPNPFLDCPVHFPQIDLTHCIFAAIVLGSIRVVDDEHI